MGQTKFVFFKDNRKMFRLQGVPLPQGTESGGFNNRCFIHKDFRGLRGEELNYAAGINDGEFVHMGGFMGGAWSLESCLKIAEASLAQ